METFEETEQGLESNSKPCSNCQERSRSYNSSWCSVCRNAQAAVYRARMRVPPATEERVCILEECEETFLWRSSHSRQVGCCRSHYQKWRWRESHPRFLEDPLKIFCTKCSQWFSRDSFSPSRQKFNKSWCRACSAVYRKEWNAKNPERLAAATRRSRTTKILRLYGAPSDSFEQLLREQDNKCACCGEEHNASRAFHIDHDHKNGAYRGLLCHGCNVGLGGFKDDPVRLRAAVEYLDRC